MISEHRNNKVPKQSGHSILKLPWERGLSLRQESPQTQMERTRQCVTLGSHMHTQVQLDFFISTLQSLRGERQELAGSAPNLSSSLMTASCWPGSSMRALQCEGFFIGPSSSERRGKETERQPQSPAFVSISPPKLLTAQEGLCASFHV